MGEGRKRKLSVAVERAVADEAALVLDTFGGKLHVKFDHTASVTMLGQLPFFVELLQASGLYERWIKSAPLHYNSPNAPSVQDVLGTLFIAALSGMRRYRHINALRADGVSPGLLGMTRIVSDDSLTRALGAMDEAAADLWLADQFDHLCTPLQTTPWILDIDTTIKPIYGHQEGATLGYNPHKPGRPSHAYHSYLMSELRLVLDVAVSPGREMASKHALPGLASVLDRCGATRVADGIDVTDVTDATDITDTLSPSRRPRLVRGDCGFGNEATLEVCESRHVDYLFRLRQSANVKKLITRLFHKDGWQPADCGYEAYEATLKLVGWTCERRVVVLRRRVRDKHGCIAVANEATGQLSFLDDNDPIKLYEHVVLVTSLGREGYELRTIAQLYRDRADCENGFDELKNQWGWTGFTSQEIKRSTLMARHIALIYNWWSLFVRAAHPKARREAITSRPMLLNAVGRQTEHAGQRHLLITSMHVAKEAVVLMLTNVHELLGRIKATAAQLLNAQPWHAIAALIVEQILACKPPIPRTPLHVADG